MTETHLSDRLLARTPTDDTELALTVLAAGVGSAAVIGGWVSTLVPGVFVPAAVMASLLVVPGVFAAIFATAGG